MISGGQDMKATSCLVDRTNRKSVEVHLSVALRAALQEAGEGGLLTCNAFA